jgi:hypothetical protein
LLPIENEVTCSQVFILEREGEGVVQVRRIIAAKDYFMTLGVIYIALLLISQVLPFYYETGNDVHARIVSSGIFSGLPEGLLSSYGCFVLLSDLYAWLSIRCPSVNWFDLFGIFFLAVTMSQCILIIINSGIKENIYFKAVGLSVLSVLLMNVIQSEPTRTSLILSGSSLLLLYQFDRKFPVFLRLWIYLMIIAGMLIRIESGLLALIIVQLSAYLTQPYKLSIFKKSLPINILTILLLIFVNLPRNAAEARYLEIRPYQFTLWDYHQNHEGVVLKTTADTIKLSTAKQSFLADEEALSPSFFQSIHLKQTDKTPGDLLNYFQSMPEQAKRMVEYFEKYVIGYFFLSAAFVLFLFFMWNKVKRPVNLLKQCALFALSIMLIAFFMKMEWRLYYPLASLCFLTMYSLPLQKERIAGPNQLLAFLLVLVSAANIFTISAEYYARKNAISKELQVAREALSTLPKDAIVLLDKNTLINWLGYYFQKVDMKSLPLLIPYDNGLLFTQNSHKEFLHKTFGCMEFECVTRLTLDAHHTYLLADDNRKKLIVNYLREVYSILIKFEPVQQHTHIILDGSHHQGLLLYKISRQ